MGTLELFGDQHWNYHETRHLLFLLQIFSGDASGIGGYVVQFVDLEFEYFIVPSAIGLTKRDPMM